MGSSPAYLGNWKAANQLITQKGWEVIGGQCSSQGTWGNWGDDEMRGISGGWWWPWWVGNIAGRFCHYCNHGGSSPTLLTVHVRSLVTVIFKHGGIALQIVCLSGHLQCFTSMILKSTSRLRMIQKFLMIVTRQLSWCLQRGCWHDISTVSDFYSSAPIL